MAPPPVFQKPGGVWRWLPSRCAVCRNWPHAPLCEDCISHFAQPMPRCSTCALPLPANATTQLQRCGACLRSPPPLDLCLTATAYAWPWTDLIAQLKFHQQAGWARPLGQLMMSAPWVEDTLTQADRVLPIPLSAERLAERGYNQSLLLARQLSASKTAPGLLLRTRHTPAQRTLPRAERLANLTGAFAIDPLRISEIRGQRLVLVDDVMTSGASLHTAAQVLRQAGAAHISAVVLARTEADEA
ncbi:MULTISPECIES: ComF family protein [unclassified Limnohabitans]|uniref:ComF family protein n=1 Tax=Limnohabitans sp. MMS-10A-192 TaxID=1835769 RepID=UPI001E5260FB|nr:MULTISPECIES: ComF family protein [unclassified Limnohabitans]